MPNFPSLIDLSTLGSDGIKLQGDTTNNAAGASVSSAGDINGDGFDDYIVGSPQNSSGGYWAGAVYVLFGKAGGFGAIDLGSLSAADGFKIQGDATDDTAGESVRSAGDINGDGYDDIIVGASGNGTGTGAAYVIFGKASGFATIDLTSLAVADGFKIQGAANDFAGRSVSSAGDVNGDGYDDMIVGAPGDFLTGNSDGSAYVIFGKAGGFATIDLASLAPGAGFRIDGDNSEDNAGASVSSAGDVNGDGYDDILIGAPGNDSGGDFAGAAYVIFGKASGFANIDLGALAPSAGFKIQGDANRDFAGVSVSSAGDVNRDGYDDIIIGAREESPDPGKAYVIFGKASGFGTIDLGALAAADGFSILGAADRDLAGWSVSSAGDVNGDGFDDVIVGARYNDSGGYNAGAAYVIFGKASGFGTINLSSLAVGAGFKIEGEAVYDLAGASVSSAGDVNHDGFDDILVGARRNDSGDQNAGAAYLIFGRGDANLAPSGADIVKTILEDSVYVLAAADFGFTDSDGEDFEAVKITTLPGTGALLYDADGAGPGSAVAVTAGQTISIAAIEAGKLSFVPAPGAYGVGYASFTFQVQDDGAAAYGGADLDPTPNSFTFNVTDVFDPVGDFPALIDLGALDGLGFKIQGDSAGSEAGWSVSSGDVNGDGLDDLFVGAFGYGGGANAAAYVIFGKAGGYGNLDLTNFTPADGFRINGAAAAMSLSSGDINGDGFDEILLGTNVAGGTAYVIFGKATGLVDIDIASLAAADGFSISGGGLTGFSVSSAGDVNGDGYDDIIIGAERESSGGSQAGAAYVIFGKAGGFGAINLAALAPADGFKILGDAANDYAGGHVSSAGDVNGDGFDDLLIGTDRNDSGGNQAGAAYLIFGKSGPFSTLDLASLAAVDGFKIEGEAAGDYAGRGVSSAGDVNGDGFQDFIIGARNNDAGGNYAGAAYVIFGKAGLASVDLSALGASDGFKIVGDAAYDVAGISVSSAGDVNGDGFDDMIVGAFGNNGGGDNAGAAYVIFGKASGFGTIDLATLTLADGFKIQGEADNDLVGLNNVSAAGDIDGDGFGDIIVGSQNDNGGADAGAAYVIFGQAPTLAVVRTGSAVGQTIRGGIGDDSLYGLGGNDSLYGDGGDDILDGGTGDDAMAGGTGNDIYFVDSAGDSIVELPGEDFDEIRTGLATYSLAALPDIEVLTGLGGSGQTLTGNDSDNVIDGGLGADTMIGGIGNDSYFVDNAGDIVTENGGEGTDLILTDLATFSLAALPNVEFLIGLGNVNQTLTGNDSANYIDGGLGADAMAGGIGNDFYVVDNAGDTVTENSGAGIDQITTGLSTYSIAALANVENLYGTNAAGQTLTGNAGGNAIVGAAGNDLIDGGAGVDSMAGGFGNDIYIVDNAADMVTENAGEGIDEIRASSAAYTIASWTDVEKLTGTNAAGQSLTGNGLANVITGAAGNDVIDGGTGADAMAGGAGNDIYVVDNAGDVVTENASQGTDEIRTGLAAYSIASLANIENLTGTNTAGQTLTGNGGSNVVTGAAGNDMIDGGAGIDTMVGGAGNDVYFADSAFDTVTELAGQGTDEVRTTSAVYELGANVENLTAATNIDHTLFRGNDGNNVITGGTGSDWIDSRLGKDIVDGLGGNDTLWVGYESAMVDPYAGASVANALSIVTSSGGSFGGVVRTVDGVSTVTFSSIETLHVTLDYFHNTFIINASAVALGASLYVDGNSGIDTFDADLSGLASVDFNAIGGGGGDPPNTSFGRIINFEIFKLNLTAGADHVVTGNGNDTLLGNGGNDVLNSGGGNDMLDGGAGADAMTGGAGQDIYIIDSAADSVTENGGEGTDEIRTALVAYSLAGVANVENLTGTNAAGQTLTGNGLDNVILGAAGNDVIDGGLGIDAMAGGAGSDIYIVDNGGDMVIELGGQGTDEIRTALAVYSLAGLANVEILTTTSNVNHDFRGNGANNIIAGAGGNDLIRLQDGGVDTIFGAGGNDVFLFGATLTSADSVDGGIGTDQIAIQGDYSAGLTLGAGIVSVESFAILPGSDARFGDTAGNFYDYSLATVDSNVAAGVQMVIDANRLRLGEDFTFNGSAETDGRFFVYGGGGTDNLLGGLGNDTFYFGENGQFGATDRVHGGAGGTDQLGLRGNYTIVFGATQLTSIESLGLVSAQDTRFGALGTSYNYNLTMNDGNLAAGVRMTVDAAPLRGSETLTFDGSAELDGSFRIFGGQGADTIKGSQSGDLITGGTGADSLRGGGGADQFIYRSVADSTSAAHDTIHDFASGDLINLSQIDAISGGANDAFTFIGSNAFSNTAGELRAVFENNAWTVQGDVNGDGIADIEMIVVSDHPMTGTDFVL